MNENNQRMGSLMNFFGRFRILSCLAEGKLRYFLNFPAEILIVSEHLDYNSF